jgi:hypothetical protein
MKLFTLTAILVCAAVPHAAADSVIDQENVAPNGLGHIIDFVGDYDAQTFTVRNTGQITSVGLQLYFEWEKIHKPVTDNMHFKLTGTNAAGDPAVDNVLATYDISSSVLPTGSYGLPMTELDLRDQNVHVHSGDVLALVISTNYTYMTHSENQDYVWEANNRDAIPGGFFYRYVPKYFGPQWNRYETPDPPETWDLGYRITIDTVPEPSAILLGALAIVALIGLPRRTART